MKPLAIILAALVLVASVIVFKLFVIDSFNPQLIATINRDSLKNKSTLSELDAGLYCACNNEIPKVLKAQGIETDPNAKYLAIAGYKIQDFKPFTFHSVKGEIVISGSEPADNKIYVYSYNPRYDFPYELILVAKKENKEAYSSEYRIIWPESKGYKDKISSLKIKPETALLKAREEGKKQGSDAMWPEPLCIIDKYYFFGIPTKVDCPLQGFLVEGYTGRVHSIHTDIVLKSEQNTIPKDVVDKSLQH